MLLLSRSIGQMTLLTKWWHYRESQRINKLQRILWGTWMSVSNQMAIHPTVDETVHSKPQMPTSWWCCRQSQRIAEVVRIHPLWTFNVFRKIHDDPSCSCFQSGLKWFTNWQTDLAISRTMSLACLKSCSYESFLDQSHGSFWKSLINISVWGLVVCEAFFKHFPFSQRSSVQ